MDLRRGVHLEWFADDGDGGKIKYLIANWGRAPEGLNEQESAAWALDRNYPVLFNISRDDVLQMIRDVSRMPGLEDATEPRDSDTTQQGQRPDGPCPPV